MPIFAGTGNFLGEVYLDGIPTTTANQQGDSRVIVNSIPVESVDQLRVISSGPSAEYQGAGAIAFTTKSGGNQYHGQVVDLVRNTIFDTWGFTAPAATKPGPNGTVVPAGKPVKHQNELSISAGGPIPFTRHKGFFFVNYDRYHGRNGVNPAQFTVPTILMKQGDFTELGSKPVLFDPTTNNCPTPTTCTRQPYNGLSTPNVISSSAISGISQYEQKFMPDPTSPAGVIANNYLAGGIPTGFDNWEITAKIDYDLTASQRVSFFYSHGVRQSVGYGANPPLPYTASDTSAISPTVLIFEHSIVLTPHMVNQFVYGLTRFPQPVTAPTYNLAPYRAGPDVGIGNLPPGQSSENFPGSAFAATTAFPVHTYWKNFGPRLGLAYSVNDKTVIRAGYSLAYSRAGGVSGRAGDSTGTGQAGFDANLILPAAVATGVNAGPSYYLNDS